MIEELLNKTELMKNEDGEPLEPIYVICSHCSAYKTKNNTWVSEDDGLKYIVKQQEKIKQEEYKLSHSLCIPCRDFYMDEL